MAKQLLLSTLIAMLLITRSASPQTNVAGTSAVPGFTFTTNGALNAQPTADVVTLTVKCYASGSSDCLDIYNASGSKAVWVDSGGNLNFLGRNFALGLSGQTGSASLFQIYGGTSPKPGGQSRAEIIRSPVPRICTLTQPHPA